MIGPSAVSRAVPQIHLQLVIVGAAVALLVAGLILSPPGRASGGLLAPMLAAALAAAVRQAARPDRQVMTHRLSGPTAGPHDQAQAGHKSSQDGSGTGQ